MDNTLEYKYFKELKNYCDKIFDELKRLDGSDNVQVLIKTAIYVYNASFACEIGLKTIYLESNDEYIYGHLIEKLYLKISPSIQQIIKNNMPTLQFDNNDINYYISVINNNFAEWRYFYETKDREGIPNKMNTNLLFLYEFLNAIQTYLESC